MDIIKSFFKWLYNLIFGDFSNEEINNTKNHNLFYIKKKLYD